MYTKGSLKTFGSVALPQRHGTYEVSLKSELFGTRVPVSVALRQRLKSLISGTSVGS